MRVVTTPIDQGGGVVQFWALRSSEHFANLGGALDDSAAARFRYRTPNSP
jgi:hypothetical protein